MRGLPFFMHDA